MSFDGTITMGSIIAFISALIVALAFVRSGRKDHSDNDKAILGKVNEIGVDVSILKIEFKNMKEDVGDMKKDIRTLNNRKE
jgi:hypothetical protein